MTDHWKTCWQEHPECAHERSAKIDFLIMLFKEYKMPLKDMADITGRSVDAIGKRLRKWIPRDEYNAILMEIKGPNKTKAKFTPYPPSDRLNHAYRMRKDELLSLNEICKTLGFDLARLVITMKQHWGEDEYDQISYNYKDRYRISRKELRKHGYIKFPDTFHLAYMKQWAPEFEVEEA